MNTENTTAAATESITMSAAAAAFGSIALANGNGAEPAPMGVYTFDETDGYPTLIGGTWKTIDGKLTIEKELYDAEGQSYHGKPKSVKLVVIRNQTGVKYRLSGAALQAAFKAAGKPDSFSPVELSQEIDDTAGYSKATIKLA